MLQDPEGERRRGSVGNSKVNQAVPITLFLENVELLKNCGSKNKAQSMCVYWGRGEGGRAKRPFHSLLRNATWKLFSLTACEHDWGILPAGPKPSR